MKFFRQIERLFKSEPAENAAFEPVIISVENEAPSNATKSFRDVMELFLPIVAAFKDDGPENTPRSVRKFDESMLNTWGIDIDNLNWSDVDARPIDDDSQDWFDYYDTEAFDIKADPRWAHKF